MTRFNLPAAAFLRLAFATNLAGAPRLSLDARQVACELDGRIHVIDSCGGSTRAILSSGLGACWSRVGRAIHFLSDRDDNAPQLRKLPADSFGEATQFTSFDRGIGTELVVYPGTHHGGWTEDFEKDRLRRTHEWFDKHLGASSTATVH